MIKSKTLQIMLNMTQNDTRFSRIINKMDGVFPVKDLHVSSYSKFLVNAQTKLHGINAYIYICCSLRGIYIYIYIYTS